MKKFLIILLILIASPFLFFFLVHPTHNWHQKITLEVHTPDGLKTGSSVVSIWWTEGSRIGGYFPGTNMANSSFQGEAVVVEVLPGQYLFALLKGVTHLGDPQFVALKMFGQTDGTIKRSASILKNTRQKENIPRDRYPLLVTFRDINDPASVVQVDPNNLSATFGPGVELKQITLKITDEPVTRGRVKQLLGWIDEYYNTMFDGNRSETIKTKNRFANSLASGVFKTERSK